jgi:hypothetical protein
MTEENQDIRCPFRHSNLELPANKSGPISLEPVRSELDVIKLTSWNLIVAKIVKAFSAL